MKIINFLATDGINLTGILYNIDNKTIIIPIGLSKPSIG